MLFLSFACILLFLWLHDILSHEVSTMTTLDIGKAIRKLRKERGLTQIQLSNNANMAVNSIRLYESGKRIPSMDVRLELAEALGCSFEELLDENEKNAMFYRTVMGIMNNAANTRKDSIERFTHNELGLIIIDLFEQLNHEGRSKAVDYMHDLSENPKYQRGTSTKQETPPEGQINPADS